MAERELDIWYVSGMRLCNFDCAYCAAGIPERGGERSRKELWMSPDGAALHRRIVERLAALPYRFGLRLQTIGEPMVSDELLASAAFMTRQPNVRFVELVTNGSLLERRLLRIRDDHDGDLSNVSLWVTYHHTQISVADLVENVAFAQPYVKQVVVNALLFPDNVAQIDELHQACRAQGLRVNVDPGYNHNAVYETSLLPLMDLDGADERLGLLAPGPILAANLLAVGSPLGQPCSAGSDYVYVNRAGDVHACLAYSYQRPGARLGSLLDDDFVLPLRDQTFAPCELASGCRCKEDFLHLEVAHRYRDRTASLGTWQVPPGDARLSEATRAQLDAVYRDRPGGKKFLKVIAR